MTGDDPQGPVNQFENSLLRTDDRSRAEAAIEALRAEGGVFVEAVRATRMPMVVTDPSLPGNPIVFANDAFLRLSGYKMAEVLGQQPHFMNGRETDAADALRFREALEQNVDAVIETVQYRKDGSRFVAAVLVSAFKDNLGGTLNQFLSYLDISRRAEAEGRLAASMASEERLRCSEERHAFLLALSDALRSSAEAEAAIAAACRVVGERLEATRVIFGEIDDAAGLARTKRGWARDGAPQHPAALRLADFGGPLLDDLRAGRVVRFDDVGEPPYERPDLAGLASIGVKAGLSVPLMVDAKFVANLNIQQDRRRRWTEREIDLLQEAAERMWAALERAKAEEALRASEDRFRSFAENSSDALWIADVANLRLDYLSPSYVSIFGESREPIMADIGRWRTLVHPDDRERAAKALPRAAAGEAWQEEYRVVRPADGETRWILDTGFPIPSTSGRVERVGGVAQDVTTRKAAEQELRRSRRALRELIEGIPQLVWRAVDGGKWIWASPQWTAFTGLDEEASAGWGWLDAIHPDDQDAISEAWEQARAARSGLDAECRIAQRGGGYRWFAIRARPLDPSLDDERLEWLGTSTDIHDLRKLQEEQKVLVRELHHRTRNLMAVVASIARQTASRAADLDSFLGSFDERLFALSRVQELLTRPEDEPITIGTLVRLELDALAADVDRDRILVKGPDVVVPRGSAQTLALAFHELATNARKYGALAGPGGRLDVHWVIGELKGGRSVVLEWVEEGVSPVASRKPSGGGYGRQLIERALPRVLGAETRFELGERGVRCMIALPL